MTALVATPDYNSTTTENRKEKKTEKKTEFPEFLKKLNFGLQRIKEEKKRLNPHYNAICKHFQLEENYSKTIGILGFYPIENLQEY